MPVSKQLRIGVNGYGVIGTRVAAAVAQQAGMVLTGVSDVVTDWRTHMVIRNGFRLFAATAEHVGSMRAAGLEVTGTLDDLLGDVDVIVDCNALTRAIEDASESIAMTNAALGIAPSLVDAPRTVTRTEAWSAR